MFPNFVSRPVNNRGIKRIFEGLHNLFIIKTIHKTIWYLWILILNCGTIMPLFILQTLSIMRNFRYLGYSIKELLKIRVEYAKLIRPHYFIQFSLIYDHVKIKVILIPPPPPPRSSRIILLVLSYILYWVWMISLPPPLHFPAMLFIYYVLRYRVYKIKVLFNNK